MAEVIEIGEKVREVKVGDVVSVPFQISCGTCINCNRGLTGYCVSTSPISTYGFGTHLQFGGAMSDKLLVPYADHMLLKIPENIDAVHLASLSDNVPDAYRNVGYALGENRDQRVLVIGGVAKSIGLYTVLIARALGAAQIDYVDRHAERLMEAQKVGAGNVVQSMRDIREQYDIVVDASGTEKGLSCAMKSVRGGGLVCSSGIFIRKTHVPLVQMYAKGVTFRTGLANSRTDAIKVLALIQQRKLELSAVTSVVGSWEKAEESFLSRRSKVIVARECVTGN